MKIWFLITEEERQRLIAFQDKHFPMIPLTPPVDDRVFPDKEEEKFQFVENLEELEKEMKKKSRRR